MTDERSDELIAAAVQAGDAEAYGILIDRYEGKLSRYARRFLSRPDDITDLVQDVFTRAYINLQSFDPDQRFSPWIYRIAHNLFVNELRRKERRGGFGIFDADVILPQIPARETADEATLRAELTDELQTVIDDLKPKYREVILLFYYEDLSYEEISQILKIPKTTVGVRITRGRAQLETLLAAKESII